MNQSSEIQQVKKYKPLLYITPSDQSSLQESLSSAINTVTIEKDDDKLSSRTSNLLSMLNTEVVISETNLRDIILSSFIFPFYPYSFYKTVKKIITDQKNTQGKEQAKLDENTKLVLSEFNLEG